MLCVCPLPNAPETVTLCECAPAQLVVNVPVSLSREDATPEPSCELFDLIVRLWLCPPALFVVPVNVTFTLGNSLSDHYAVRLQR